MSNDWSEMRPTFRDLDAHRPRPKIKFRCQCEGGECTFMVDEKDCDPEGFINAFNLNGCPGEFGELPVIWLEEPSDKYDDHGHILPDCEDEDE